MPALSIDSESWQIQGGFTISRGSKTHADVVVVSLYEKTQTGEILIGRGECVPYARYGESINSVIAQIESVREPLENGLNNTDLQALMPAGAARNAVDCALWDLQAKQQKKRIWDLIPSTTACHDHVGEGAQSPLITAYTLSLDTPEIMHASACTHAHRPLLKLKLAERSALECVQAVREGAPNARIIVDANEGWNVALYEQLIPELLTLGVEMIEQPLPADNDDALAHLERPITVCADESCHDVASLKQLADKYDMINIKLDKTGGLTEALLLRQAAEQAGMQIMVGCMLGTSLAMAPAMFVAKGVPVVDLDGPLLLSHDREAGIDFSEGVMRWPHPELWG